MKGLARETVADNHLSSYCNTVKHWPCYCNFVTYCLSSGLIICTPLILVFISCASATEVVLYPCKGYIMHSKCHTTTVKHDFAAISGAFVQAMALHILKVV